MQIDNSLFNVADICLTFFPAICHLVSFFDIYNRLVCTKRFIVSVLILHNESNFIKQS